jgi:hypothetical protein
MINWNVWEEGTVLHFNPVEGVNEVRVRLTWRRGYYLHSKEHCGNAVGEDIGRLLYESCATRKYSIYTQCSIRRTSLPGKEGRKTLGDYYAVCLCGSFSRFWNYAVVYEMCLNTCHLRRRRRHAISINNMADARACEAEEGVAPHAFRAWNCMCELTVDKVVSSCSGRFFFFVWNVDWHGRHVESFCSVGCETLN